MKKYLLLLASAALLLVGCAKENFSEPVDGKLVNATFTASVDGGVATRASADGDGKGTKVNRCIMELYFGETLYTRLVESVTPASGEAKAFATFSNVPVVAGKQYRVLFWADCGGAEKADKYYTTTNLKTVTVDKEAFIAALEAGENDNLDAFYFAETRSIPQSGDNSYTVSLKRPFAQLNVITTDVAARKTVTSADLLPEKVSVSYSAANAINVATSEISGTETYAYEASVYGDKTNWEAIKNRGEYTLSMDYILASTEQGAVDVTFKTINGSTEVMTHNLTNLPYQRNYRTNVKGDLLTTSGSWKATIDPIWDQPDIVKVVEVADIKSANEIINQYASTTDNLEVKFVGVPNDSGIPTGEQTSEFRAILTSPLTQDANLGIEVMTSTKTLYVGDYKVEYNVEELAEAAQLKAATVNINVPQNSGIETLVINAPTKTVLVNGKLVENVGTITNIDAITSLNTLIIEPGQKVGALTMRQGGLEIHGTVEQAIVPEGHGEIQVRDCENLKESEVYNVLMPHIAEGYIGIKDRTTVGLWDIVPVVCKIGETPYASLSDAVAVVQNNETITFVRDVESAAGIAINSGKTFTIDFAGHKYIVNKPGAGSTGTQTSAFQLVKGQTVTFKNGTIKASEENLTAAVAPAKNIKRMFQSYANVNFENMTIDGTNLYENNSVCEFACGAVNISGTTSITTGKQGVAVINVDTWKDYYPEGAQVTISSTGQFGDIYLYSEDGSAAQYTKSSLTITNGTFGKVYGDDSEEWTATVKGGLFTEKPNSKYLPNAFYAQLEGHMWRVVYDDTYVVRVNETYYRTWREAAQAATNAYGSPVEDSEVEVIRSCTASDEILKSSGFIKLIVNQGVTLTSTLGNALISTNPGNTGVEITGGGNIVCSSGSTKGTLVDGGHGGVTLDNVYVKAECLARNNVPTLTIKSGKYEKIGDKVFINSGCDVTINDEAIFNYDISQYAKAGKTCEEVSGMPGWYHLADLTEHNAAFKVTNGDNVKFFGSTADYCKFDDTAEGWIKSSQADGDEITLLKDIQGYFILSKNSVTLNLNDKTLTGSLSYNTSHDGAVCCIYGDNQTIKDGKIDLSSCSNAVEAINVGLNCRLGNSLYSMSPAKNVSVSLIETIVDASNQGSLTYYSGTASYDSQIDLTGVKFSSRGAGNILPNQKPAKCTIKIENGCKFYPSSGQKLVDRKFVTIDNIDNIETYLSSTQKLNGSGYNTWREVVAR